MIAYDMQSALLEEQRQLECQAIAMVSYKYLLASGHLGAVDWVRFKPYSWLNGPIGGPKA